MPVHRTVKHQDGHLQIRYRRYSDNGLECALIDHRRLQGGKTL